MKTDCDCCGYKNIECKENTTDKDSLCSGDKINLCEICYSTFLSSAVTYPRDSDSRLYRSIGWIANHIIATIERTNPNRRSQP